MIQVIRNNSYIFKYYGQPFLFILLALYLDLIPLPYFLESSRPDLFILVFAYYILRMNTVVGLLYCFFSGFLFDVIFLYKFGSNSISLLCMYFLLNKFSRQISYFPLWQQSAYITSIIIFTSELKKIGNNLSFNDWISIHFCFKIVIVYFAWPWISAILERINEREE